MNRQIQAEFHFLEITCPQKHSSEKVIDNSAFEVEDKFEKIKRRKIGVARQETTRTRSKEIVVGRHNKIFERSTQHLLKGRE